MGRPPGSGKLAAHVGFFRELVAQDPDITLFELRAHLPMLRASPFIIRPLPLC